MAYHPENQINAKAMDVSAEAVVIRTPLRSEERRTGESVDSEGEEKAPPSKNESGAPNLS
jgi:hypothetical protein